ncbi:hypothetical protein AArcCO_2511 [Halalkaliarchaeum sp. AArc-CO]|uniref:hypothetical protein n=1 Tax=Halalkaliarchaeum sp. AArc-CO TaxID=2866381 RepID=UPI00217EA192|nr:hypothetical protein [Halalkaliarchaeum sp. AArc-CO]UWG51797.1 hypothetical protein AArcCO_2511 [Halalkaliarchaeum sp. AArc-CO]
MSNFLEVGFELRETNAVSLAIEFESHRVRKTGERKRAVSNFLEVGFEAYQSRAASDASEHV